jgi:quercetin dioxygenase-like cupin family protein
MGVLKMIVENDKVLSRRLDDKTSRKVLEAVGSLMLVEVSFKKGGVGAAHSHDKHEQVSYIAGGSFEVTVGTEKKILKKGDSYYVPLNVMHGVRALEDSVILDVFTPIREDFLKG